MSATCRLSPDRDPGGKRFVSPVNRLVLLCVSGCLYVSAVLAGDNTPLAPPDTSSPRATMQSFQRINEKAQGSLGDIDQTSRQLIEKVTDEAMRCLDLSAVPRERVDDEGEEAAILLQEILDRIEIPDDSSIPDAAQVKDAGLTRWTLPDTEITVAKVAEGPREGEWLFSPETIKRLNEFYRKVADHPYREDALWGSAGPAGGLYDYYLLLPEPSLPSEWVENLPGWSKTIYLEQPVWKWGGSLLVVAAGIFLFITIFRLSRRTSRAKSKQPGVRWYRLAAPLSGAAIAYLVDYLIDEQISAAGRVDAIIEIVTLGIAIVCLSWAAIVLGEVLSEWIVSSPRIDPRGLDASIVSIIARVVSLAIAVWVLVQGAEHLGLSLIPLLAGLGVGGLAIALAVRPTFENLIGGLILFIDKPVRVGERCRFAEQLGDVEEIGLRSTRVRTLDDTIISVPNAEFSQLQLENVSRRRRTLFRTVLGLRYETSAEQLRYILVEIRRMLVAHSKVSRQRLRARFIRFGDYSLDVEVFAYVRTRDWDEYWGIQEDLNLRIMDIIEASGSGFAFPSQTAYLTRDTGLNSEQTKKAEDQVEAWRAQGKLPFPELDDQDIRSIEDTLSYPPEGSPPGSGSRVP
ncbi:MAG: mechanosensitive ion channel family protein [Pseudomonadota bacterium]|nr:mechanosensitive ion channel family protein [Pseudomonadota bacterium]